MSVGLPSDEVAEDYKHSLEDLTINSRYEINNLTVIAKENTEHAMAISRVLETHIKNTPPDRKLPALYVLDSVVKNVGTPYTLFLGHNLYVTFMNAYSLVNTIVRRKLDEMLKTWKEPVPGSMDPRPVFSAEIIRPIENALIKARTAFLQHHQQEQQQIQRQQQQMQQRNQQEMIARGRSGAAMNTQWRNTPTPPQPNGQYYPPPPQQYPPPNLPNNSYQPPSYPQYPPPTLTQPHPASFQQPYQQTAPPQYQPPPNHLHTLHKDIENLISSARTEFARNYHDTSIQTRLKALLDLQTILNTQHLPPDQIQAIRDQVAQLSVVPRPMPAAQPPPTPSSYDPRPSIPQPQIPLAQPQIPLPQPPPSQVGTPGTTDISAQFSSKSLADIIANVQRAPRTPPTSQASLAQSQPTTPSSVPTSQNSSQNSLLASLRAAGILPKDSGTPVDGSLGFAPPPATKITPPVGGQQRPALINDVELTSASLKKPRPHLLSALYEARPNQCSTCGRRFLASEAGREKKARHLDWHFRTNQRLLDSAKRGQSRSWYVDELEWIKSRDNPEDAPQMDLSSAAKAAIAASAHAADPKNRHIPVPSDPALANLPCPICQEKFSTVWSEEAQDFVWMDAMKIGNRIYHGSCNSEVKREGGTTPLRTATPDSVLGKRKAIGDITSGNAKAVKA